MNFFQTLLTDFWEFTHFGKRMLFQLLLHLLR